MVLRSRTPDDHDHLLYGGAVVDVDVDVDVELGWKFAFAVHEDDGEDGACFLAVASSFVVVVEESGGGGVRLVVLVLVLVLAEVEVVVDVFVDVVVAVAVVFPLRIILVLLPFGIARVPIHNRHILRRRFYWFLWSTSHYPRSRIQRTRRCSRSRLVWTVATRCRHRIHRMLERSLHRYHHILLIQEEPANLLPWWTTYHM